MRTWYVAKITLITPRRQYFKALGAQFRKYAHVSMILGDDGQKLSTYGAVA